MNENTVSLTYHEAQDLISESFKNYSKEELKAFCDKHKLNYLTTIAIVRKHQVPEMPKFVQKLLVALGYSAACNKIIMYSIHKSE